MLANELSQEQLDEIKSRYFYEIVQDEGINSPDEISNEFIIDWCESIEFTNDDFFCTMEQ